MKLDVKQYKPFGFILFFLLTISVWHLSLIWIMPGIDFPEIFRGLIILFDLYIAVSLIFTVLLFLVFRKIKKQRWVRLILLKLMAIALFLQVIRVIDWGTIYFSGNHIDSIFWYHAFYVDGTSFFFTKISAIVFSVLFIWLILFYRQLRSFIAVIPEIEKDIPGYAKRNGIAAAVLLLVLNITLIFSSPDVDSKDKKQYVAVPEQKVFGSFIDYIANPDKMEEFVMDQPVLEKLKKCGIVINDSSKFPLMKNSIYLDPKNKTMNKPRITDKTNIVIILLESFNSIFLEEKRHGYYGLTPNLQEVRNKSLSLTRMYSAAWPTESGMIGILGSSLYKLNRLKGPLDKHIPPIPCRFMLLSDVLKPRGYTNIHIKGGSGLFGGLKSSFERKQSYDKFIAWESVELQMYAKSARKKGWGIRDDDIFEFAANLLKENKIKEPFLLTMNSLDMHMPFDPTHTHPNAKGSTLLNTFYSTDKGFGVLWNYFKNSRYRDNTVFIVTCDHPMGVGIDLKEFFNEFGYKANSPADYVPFYILLPGEHPWNGRTVDTLSSNLDVAPTILDMMDIDTPNPFIGLSIFSERQNYPLAITGSYTVNNAAVMDAVTPSEKKKILSIGWTEADQEVFDKYVKKTVLNRMIYPDKEKQPH